MAAKAVYTRMTPSPKLAANLDRALFWSLVLLALAAPVSIAATQTAWCLGLIFWLIRAFVVRPPIRKQDIDLSILTFVGLSLISSIFSYEPQLSFAKMLQVSLVTIVYLVLENIRDRRALHKLVTILVASAALIAIYVIGSFAVGKNIKVLRLAPDSPLLAAGVMENDTILKANGVSVSSPDDLAKVLANAPKDSLAEIVVYRYEAVLGYYPPVAAIPDLGDSMAKFGILQWSRGRDTRATAFYSIHTTYSEAVQLLLSLAFGLFIAATGGFFSRTRILLALAVGAMAFALALTVTRASWAAFLLSATVMVIAGTSRRTILICLLCAVPVFFAAVFYLQQKRNVSFVDKSDTSTTYRETVWREGFNLLISNPRHLAVGVGMNSINNRWPEWHMYDNGKLIHSHLHSTPLMLAFERGIPTLVAWIVWMAIYLTMLWRGLRQKDLDWLERGVLLGALGGTAGFLASGFVHYNLGDSVVAMIFYIIMGFSLAILRGIDREPLKS